jgi:hypothetical protein
VKRILLGLISALILAFGSLWLLLFTITGNGIIKPWLESYLQGYVPEAKLEAFSLNPEQTHLILSLQQNARLEVDAITNLWQKSALGTWRLHATDLSELQAVLPLALAGSVSSEGRFVISPNALEVDGKVQLPHSLVNLHAQQTSADSPITAQLSGDIALVDLWTLLKQPKIASGTASLVASAEIPRQHPLNLSGQATLNLPDGKLYHQGFNTLTEQALPQDVSFQLNSQTDILSGNSLTQLKLQSDLANVQLTNARYQLGDDQLSTQHELSVSDLGRLTFITQTPLHGSIQVTGDAHYQLSSKALKAKANSDTLGGRVTTQLINQQFTAQLQDLSAVEVSKLLGMKPVFQSRLDGKLSYTLNQQQGDFSALLTDGQILPNDVSALLNQAARFDITREVYKTVTTSGRIQQKVMTADLDMQSRLTHITSQAARVDLAQRQLDMLLNVDIQGLKLPVRLKGELTSPDASADFSGLLQQNLKQNAEKAAQDAINKEKEKLQQQFKLPKLF